MSAENKFLFSISIAVWFICVILAIFYFFTGEYEPATIALFSAIGFFIIAWKGLMNNSKQVNS